MLNTPDVMCTLVEEVPPVQGKFDDGQWTSFDTVVYAKTGANRLACQSDNMAFATEGRDKSVYTSDKTLDSVEELTAQESELAGGYS